MKMIGTIKGERGENRVESIDRRRGESDRQTERGLNREGQIVRPERRQLSALKQSKLSKLLVQHDSKYKSRLVTLAILRVLQSGKKSLARKIVYKTLRLLKTQYRQRSRLLTFSSAVRIVTPKFGTKKRRVRKRVFHSPVDIKKFRGTKLSV